MNDICLKWCHSHTFLTLFVFPTTRGMLKKNCELAKRVQMEEYLCSSWKKNISGVMFEIISNSLFLSHVRNGVEVPGSSCQQYVEAVIVGCCGSRAFKQKHQNLRSMCLWLVPDAIYAQWMPEIMFLMKYLPYRN